MKKDLKLKVTELTLEEMLSHPSQEYNPSTWKNDVMQMSKKYNARFYQAPADHIFSYPRFFTKYSIPEGLNFFSPYNPFSSSLTSNGFTRIFIDEEGNVFSTGFGETGNERVIKTPKGRKWLAENLCKYGVMISSEL